MAKVNRQVNLVMLGYVYDRLFVLHVHCHKLVAYLGRVLGVVDQAELLVGNVRLQFRIVLELDALTFDLLAPAILVEALSEEDHVSQDDFVIALVDSVTHPVQIQGEDLVNQHLLPVLVRQKIVISLPFTLVGSGWKLS